MATDDFFGERSADVAALANPDREVVVLGTVGTGKTWLINAMCLQANFQRTPFPLTAANQMVRNNCFTLMTYINGGDVTLEATEDIVALDFHFVAGSTKDNLLRVYDTPGDGLCRTHKFKSNPNTPDKYNVKEIIKNAQPLLSRADAVVICIPTDRPELASTFLPNYIRDFEESLRSNKALQRVLICLTKAERLYGATRNAYRLLQNTDADAFASAKMSSLVNRLKHLTTTNKKCKVSSHLCSAFGFIEIGRHQVPNSIELRRTKGDSAETHEECKWEPLLRCLSIENPLNSFEPYGLDTLTTRLIASPA